MFFVLYDNMWKCDGLFRLLMSSERFSPFIVSCPSPYHPKEFSMSNQTRLESFFKAKGFPYYNGYNFDSEEWFDIKAFEPDIIFYQQPYNAGYKGFKIEALWKRCLFGYIPYTYELEDNPNMVNNLLMNIAWKVFLPSTFEVEKQRAYLLTNGENLIATGSPLGDILVQDVPVNNNPWKVKDKSLKRVIWAPHHSILEDDMLHYSNFLEIAEQMLDVVQHYEDKIQFAFKPHPVLKRKLYIINGWGIKKTDEYYKKWAELPNTTLVEGEYVDLFKSSDAMIHDCSTFTAEYLFTKKPVMFIARENHTSCFNEFGRACYNMHYIGRGINDVVQFLQQIVLKGDDYKKNERESFFVNSLYSSNKEDAASRMYAEFLKSFEVVNTKRG